MSALQKIFCICILFSVSQFVQCFKLSGICRNVIRMIDGSKHYQLTCCKGYMRDDHYQRLTCKAICMPECTNGVCSNPGECTCDPGFIPDPANSHKCLPICTSGCPHGTCVAPDSCHCNHGYALSGFNCIPVCTEHCSNGTCLAPEDCQCNFGYRKSETNTCEPYCTTGCNDGRCVRPETCACDAGWQQVGPNTCKPICSPSCFNGVCVAPNKCKCKIGYQAYNGASRDGYTCLPHSTTSSSTVTTTIETGYTTDSSEPGYESTSGRSYMDNYTIYSPTDYTDSETSSTDEISTTESSIVETKDSQNIWIYIALGLFVLLLGTLLVLKIVFNQKLLACKEKRKYVVEDQPPNISSDHFNVTFSKITD